MKLLKSPILIALLIGAIYFVFNTVTLKQYGVSWDEPSNYLKADRFLEYFLTGNKDYLDFSKRMNVSPFDRSENSIYTSPSFLGHPPVGSYLSVITYKIFGRTLGLLNHIDGHHLALVILGAILVGATFYFSAEGLGSLAAGFFAALLLATYPRFIAHTHFNPKDLPMTLFVFLAAMFFYQSAKMKSWRRLLISSLFFGLAVGSKINAAITIVPLLLWFIVFHAKEVTQKKFPKVYFLATLAFPFIPFFIFYATWPQIWGNAFENLKTVIRSAERVGLNGPNYWQIAPVKYLIRVSPTAFLVLVCLGGATALYKIIKKDANRDFIVLVLLLIATPLIRVCMPKANAYDGIRQFLDALPPLCVLGGLGAQQVICFAQRLVPKVKKSKRLVQLSRQLNYFFKPATHTFALRMLRGLPRAFFKKKNVTWPTTIFLIITLVGLEFLATFKKYHPYELTYFNPIFGDLKKAYTYKLPYSTDYWGAVYKQGVELLNQKLPQNATLDLPFGAHMVYDYDLRKDIRINITDLTGQPKIKPEKGDFIMYYTRQSSYSGNGVIEYCEENLKPLYTINVDDVPILKVFQNTEKYRK